MEVDSMLNGVASKFGATVDPIVQEVTTEWNRLLQQKGNRRIVVDEDDSDAQDCREE